MAFECKLVEAHDIAGLGKNYIMIGEVRLAHVEEGFHLLDKLCGPDGLMFNVNAAANLGTGERMPYAKAWLAPFEE